VRIKRLFPPSVDKLTNARIARLCVLFEDLRVELAGLTLPDLDTQVGGWPAAQFDMAGHKFRTLYFLRRSIGTCWEFAEALRLLDQCSGFRPILDGFQDPAQHFWRDAISYFGRREKHWKDIRNDGGGHFGAKAAEFAVHELPGDAEGPWRSI
jgi:hypothetical protein